MAKIKTKARALLENHDALVQRRYVGDMAAKIDEYIAEIGYSVNALEYLHRIRGDYPSDRKFSSITELIKDELERLEGAVFDYLSVTDGKLAELESLAFGENDDTDYWYSEFEKYRNGTTAELSRKLLEHLPHIWCGLGEDD